MRRNSMHIVQIRFFNLHSETCLTTSVRTDEYERRAWQDVELMRAIWSRYLEFVGHLRAMGNDRRVCNEAALSARLLGGTYAS